MSHSFSEIQVILAHLCHCFYGYMDTEVAGLKVGCGTAIFPLDTKLVRGLGKAGLVVLD